MKDSSPGHEWIVNTRRYMQGKIEAVPGTGLTYTFQTETELKEKVQPGVAETGLCRGPNPYHLTVTAKGHRMP
jgi:hypothetical protein